MQAVMFGHTFESPLKSKIGASCVKRSVTVTNLYLELKKKKKKSANVKIVRETRCLFLPFLGVLSWKRIGRRGCLVISARSPKRDLSGSDFRVDILGPLSDRSHKSLKIIRVSRVPESPFGEEPCSKISYLQSFGPLNIRRGYFCTAAIVYARVSRVFFARWGNHYRETRLNEALFSSGTEEFIYRSPLRAFRYYFSPLLF